MNKRLQMAVRNAACTSCKLHNQAEDDDVCVTGQGPNGARIMVVTKFPVSDRGRKEMTDYLSEAGFDEGDPDIMWCSAVKCRVWDLDPSKTDLKACRHYLIEEMNFVQPTHVLALGGEALFATTGHAGIMKYRGKVYSHNNAVIFPTISPSMVARNPGYRDGFLADLRYFRGLVVGESATLDPYHVPGPDRRTYVGSKAALRALLTALRGAGVVSYDIESASVHGGFTGEYDPAARIVSIALTTSGTDGMEDAHVWEIPLFHPQSPWRHIWQQILRIIGKVLYKVPRRVAHNAKFDTRWLIQFGMPQLTPTFDTIIAAALLDENRPKGLKPLAQQLLGADPWGIDTKNLLTTPLDEVLEYNGLDTWHDLRLYFLFRDQLKKQPRLGRFFSRLMMPALRELIPAERRGVYVDKQVLDMHHGIAREKLADIEQRLMDFVPPQSQWPPNIREVNFGPSNFARWFLFDYLKLPVMGRGKTKDDGSPGAPSMAEAIMMDLADQIGQLDLGPDKPNIPQLMLDRALWFKRVTGFFEPYTQLLDENSRIHTTFKPWGTVTGRLSSGKEDAEKITAKGHITGANLQQVPRDPFMRGVFGSAPGYWFVEADYSQIELRLAAFMAREDTMMHLYATGQDIHMAMAVRMTGKPASAITKEERKRAKAVNFGYLYGMGVWKFIETAWKNYQLRVTEEESRAFRASFFREFPKLIPWHAKQRRLAHKFGRVVTPMGRVRHLPDIYSPMKDVQAEAERQAINSPVQAMASDMAQLAMVLIGQQFRKFGLDAHVIGTVHDADNFEISQKDIGRALPIIKNTMENLPLEELFGVHLDVPIIADLKVGTHWGTARELTVDEIYDWKAA